MVGVKDMKRMAFRSLGDRSTAPPDLGLRTLAESVGVECAYVDGRNHTHQATDETLRMALRALGIDIQSEADIQIEWDRLEEERWTRVVEPVHVHYPEASTPFLLFHKPTSC